MMRMTTVSIKIDHPNSDSKTTITSQEVSEKWGRRSVLCACAYARAWRITSQRSQKRVTDGAGMNGWRMTRSRCPKGGWGGLGGKMLEGSKKIK